MDIGKTLDGITTLVTRSWHYWNTDAAKAERGHWWHDTLYGATVGPKDSDYVYADLHAHVFDTQDVSTLVNEVSQRIDILALVEREAKDNANHLTFDRFIEKLDAKDISYEQLGDRVVCVETENGPLYVVRSIEVYTSGSSNLHGVVIVGNDGSYNEWHQQTVSLDEAVSAAERMGAFWFLDHEGSKKAPIVAFRPPKESEVKEDKALYRRLKQNSGGKRPVLEIRNLVNALWQYVTNFIPEQHANELGLAGIANSDAHFNINEIGLSRTGIPRNLIDLSSGETLLASLNNAITPEHKKELVIEGNYAAAHDFLPYMLFTGLPLVGSYLMNRLRNKHALEDLVTHSSASGQELTSRYASQQKVREMLEQYNSSDSLIVVDIDDCVIDSPAKKMAFKEGWTYAPFRTFKWLFWDGPLAAFFDIAAHRDIKAGETQAFAAYRHHVLRSLDTETRNTLA
ncbi:MAG: PHP-associated domain-containing protein, partial [Nanoarchaeota archaeon]